VSPSRRQLESALLPHLDAGFNLARWILGNDQDARDAVQTACERAILYFSALRGSESRAWFLGIVRNTSFTAMEQRSGRRYDLDVADIADGASELEMLGSASERPDSLFERKAARDSVNRVLQGLPAVFREVLVLREMEQLSYEEIASVTGVPLGTVMSRLSRARATFRRDFLMQEEHG
jgi:RNA polymerase sigma-70 factor (ECF subfamily)